MNIGNNDQLFLSLSLVNKFIRDTYSTHSNWVKDFIVEKKGMNRILKEIMKGEKSALYSFKTIFSEPAQLKFIHDFTVSKASFSHDNFFRRKNQNKPPKMDKFLDSCHDGNLDNLCEFIYDITKIQDNDNKKDDPIFYKQLIKICDSTKDFSHIVNLNQNTTPSIILYDHGITNQTFDIEPSKSAHQPKITYVFSPCKGETKDMHDLWFLRNIEYLHRLVLNGTYQHIPENINFPFSQTIQEVFLYAMQNILEINLIELIHLKSLKIHSMCHLKQLFFPENTEKINISQCHSIEAIDLSTLFFLKTLILRQNNDALKFDNIIFAEQHPKLREIVLDESCVPEIFDNSKKIMPNLKELIIHYNSHNPQKKIVIKNFQKLQNIKIKSLTQSLEIQNCPELNYVHLNYAPAYPHDYNFEKCLLNAPRPERPWNLRSDASLFHWFFTYSLITSRSTLPTVSTKYPSPQKLSPQ